MSRCATSGGRASSTSGSCPFWASGGARGDLGGDPHVFHHNRQLVYALRPAGEGAPDHDPYAPGLHHLCFRVADEEAVDRAAGELAGVGVAATRPRYYPEYGRDYYATFFEDPDGIKLEVMNFRELRRRIAFDWEARGAG